MNDEKKDYYLEKFEVELKRDYRNDTKYYEGRVKFRNDDFESFDIKVPEETSAEILNLIMPDIAFATSRLTEKLWDHVQNQKDKILKG